jgi:hypothetical protein
MGDDVDVGERFDLESIKSKDYWLVSSPIIYA